MKIWNKNELDASMYLQEIPAKKYEYTTTTYTGSGSLNKELTEFAISNIDIIHKEREKIAQEAEEYERNMSKLEKLELWLEKYPRIESVYDFFKDGIW